ncbi:MAG: hypothetical protein ALECFALPRED_005894 [Alectoria fallacina]|uniref:Uncharacterized protein n=1 Tax=Alectoria fallacina TaxID=1903189 RepID=A0A8H3G6Y0_9LECA|nr:MAG: hypothetical protein ALECFALPRED_005894 [Alectoria fallacina]
MCPHKIGNAIRFSRFNLGDASLIHYIIALCEKALEQFPSSESYQKRKAAEKKAMEEKVVEKRAAVTMSEKEKKTGKGDPVAEESLALWRESEGGK